MIVFKTVAVLLLVSTAAWGHPKSKHSAKTSEDKPQFHVDVKESTENHKVEEKPQDDINAEQQEEQLVLRTIRWKVNPDGYLVPHLIPLRPWGNWNQQQNKQEEQKKNQQQVPIKLPQPSFVPGLSGSALEPAYVETPTGKQYYYPTGLPWNYRPTNAHQYPASSYQPTNANQYQPSSWTYYPTNNQPSSWTYYPTNNYRYPTSYPATSTSYVPITGSGASSSNVAQSSVNQPAAQQSNNAQKN